MFPNSSGSESGSAVLEFITFVLVGQMLIFGGSMVLAQSLSVKVERQLQALENARLLALRPASSNQVDACAGSLVCTVTTVDGQTFRGLGYES